jgi:smad nuclear-interacting protein 1
MPSSSPKSSRYNSKYSSDRNRDRSQSPDGPRRSSQRYSSRDETQNRPRNTETTIQSPKNEEEPEIEHKPNFERSGLLAAETNVYNGVIVKYNEPSDAAKPNIKWRWYVFKGEKELGK